MRWAMLALGAVVSAAVLLPVGVLAWGYGLYLRRQSTRGLRGPFDESDDHHRFY